MKLLNWLLLPFIALALPLQAVWVTGSGVDVNPLIYNTDPLQSSMYKTALQFASTGTFPGYVSLDGPPYSGFQDQPPTGPAAPSNTSEHWYLVPTAYSQSNPGWALQFLSYDDNSVSAQLPIPTTITPGFYYSLSQISPVSFNAQMGLIYNNDPGTLTYSWDDPSHWTFYYLIDNTLPDSWSGVGGGIAHYQNGEVNFVFFDSGAEPMSALATPEPIFYLTLGSFLAASLLLIQYRRKDKSGVKVHSQV